ncbi:MAG: NAD(P)-dependent oxidoreductase [Caldilineaceae bacterium]|nr:NAD(P)-dependent oxidoreductase [Caldilineaceae bacterium]
MANEKFMITGSMGCIGAWVLRNLINEGVQVVATDLATTPTRPGLLLSDEELAQVTWASLDVTDLKAVRGTVEQHEVTHIVHLAGLQVPFCRANPSVGSQVNVVGTVNIFEAARHAGVKGLAYASSLAVLGPAENYPERPVKDNVPLLPTTLYGVYKVANEGTAQIYWQDWQVGSVGLRPYIVYGVGRDQGMTSDIAKAVLATAAGRPFHIRFDGPVGLQHANDVAQMFIGIARAQYQGAAACNLRNDVVQVADFVAKLKAMYPQSQVTFEKNAPLPFPADLDDSGLRAILGQIPHTPLETAIQQDYARFEALLQAGKIDLKQLEN